MPSVLRFTDIAAALVAVVVVFSFSRRRKTNGTPLPGPPPASFLYGYHNDFIQAQDSALLYEKWLKEYGSVIAVPWGLGNKNIVLADPKAIAHFYARETYGYVNHYLFKDVLEVIFGRGVLWAEQDQHRRQRKALNPAFTNAAIRGMSSVFLDSAHKATAEWESLLAASSDGQVVLDIPTWTNCISLDTIGIAGFSHDFHALQGEKSAVQLAFEKLGSSGPMLSPFTMTLVGPIIPTLLKFAATKDTVFVNLHKSVTGLADDLLGKTRKESGVTSDAATDRSIMGQLLKAESDDAEMYMSKEEIIAQIKTLLVAGYITTSISITWALVNLSWKPELQTKLREELNQLRDDPTYDQLSSGLPYLDAVVHETLRLHPPLDETLRVAAEDDIIPLSKPLVTATGESVTSVVVPKGSIVIAPIRTINRLEDFWGPDAKEFIPERWLDESTGRRGEIQGHRNLLTFSDGPRTCLGKIFAIMEFKAVLCTLIRNFTFEFPDGPDTPVGTYYAMLPRPTVGDSKQVPLRIRKVENI